MISIVITTYNRSWKILFRAIRSVLSQTYKNIELIVVNDSPENKVLRREIENKILALQRDEIRYYCLEQNKGACYARNYGIKKSKGEFIAFLDDDDEWMPKKLETQLNLMQDDPEIGIVYCNYYLRENNKKLYKKLKNIEKRTFIQLLEQNVIGSTSFPLIRKECFCKCGDFNVNLPSCQDWDMWLRICRKYKVKFCNKPLVYYWWSEDGITSNMNKRIEGWDMILKLYANDYKMYPESLGIYLDSIAEQCKQNNRYIKCLIYKIKRIIICQLE